MSNYSQTTNFGPKDSLPTSDPNKTIYGAQYDTEFGNISTAIASKPDSLTVASFLNVTVTGTGVPANGIYLPSANSLGFSSNTLARGAVGGAGNWIFSAPSSGTTLTVSSLNGSLAAALATTTGATGALGFGWNVGLASNYWNIYAGATDSLVIGTAGAAAFAMSTNSNQRVSISGAGNVTVNAPSSADTLTVNGLAAQTAIAIVQGAGAVGLRITDPGANATRLDLFTDNTQAYISPQGTAAVPLVLMTASTSRVSIAAPGNVTINAPSSGAALTVNSSNSGAVAVFNSGNVNGGYINYQANGSDSGYLGSANRVVTGGGVSDLALAAPGANQLVLGTSSTSRIIVGSAGNVTINAPSSGTALSITGVSGFAVIGATVVGTAAAFAAGAAAGTQITGLQFGQNGQTTWQFYQPSNSSDLRIFSTADRVVITTAGNTTFNAPASGTTVTVNGVSGTQALKVSGGAYTAASSVGFSATPTFDASVSNYFDFGALTANVTSCTISNPVAGQTILIRVKQDATGSRTFASPSGAKITGAVTATASTASLLCLTYNGTDTRWEGAWQTLPT